MKARKKGPAAAHLPQSVARRIRERLTSEKAVVVTSRDGRASRVYGVKEYLAKAASAKLNKPWTHRKSRQSTPDPLGAVDGVVSEPVRREAIYERGS